jgi:hypothetical protein
MVGTWSQGGVFRGLPGYKDKVDSLGWLSLTPKNLSFSSQLLLTMD